VSSRGTCSVHVLWLYVMGIIGALFEELQPSLWELEPRVWLNEPVFRADHCVSDAWSNEECGTGGWMLRHE
jgi:hypothetical protein